MKFILILITWLTLFSSGYSQTRTSDPKKILTSLETILATQEDANLKIYLYLRDSINKIPDSLSTQLTLLQLVCLHRHFENASAITEDIIGMDSTQTDPTRWGAMAYFNTFRTLSDSINLHWKHLNTSLDPAFLKFGELQYAQPTCNALIIYLNTLERLYQSWPLLQHGYLDSLALLKLCQSQINAFSEYPEQAFLWMQYESSILQQCRPFQDATPSYRERIRSLIKDSSKAIHKSAYSYYLANSFQHDSSAIAVTIAEEAIALAPQSTWAHEADALLKRIRYPFLNIQSPEHLLSQKPNLALLSYKNVPQVRFSLYRIGLSQKETLTSQKNTDSLLSQQKPYLTWTQNLPLPGDYQFHSTEVELPTLELGTYFLVADYTPHLSPNKHTIYHAFTVTDLSVIFQKTVDKPSSGFVCNTSEGQALSGVNVYYAWSYNRDKAPLDYKRVKTDKKGFFEFEFMGDTKRNGRVVYLCVQGKDSIEGQHYVYGSSSEKPEKSEVRLFTDRGVYRPGQTIYFKAIIHSQDQQGALIKGETLAVELFDPNHRLVHSKTLTSDAYGAVSDSFALPSSGALGAYYFDVNGTSTQASIFVESYQVQRMEIVFDPIRGRCRPGDSVHLSARIGSLNGAPLSGTRCRYFWSSRQGQRFNTLFTPPISGEVIPDAEGRVQLQLPLMTDSSLNHRPYRNWTPFYELELIAESPDGESCRQILHVNAPYEMGRFEVSIPARVDPEQAPVFSFKIDNGNGQPLPAAVQCRIYKVHTPRAYYDKPWGTPDLALIPEAEYLERYPYFRYHYEGMPESDGDSLIWSNAYNAPQDSSIRIYELADFGSGTYRCEMIALNMAGETLRSEHHFEILFSKSTQAQLKKPVYLHHEKTEYNPGDTLSYSVGSSETKQWVLVEVMRASEKNTFQWIQLNNSEQNFRFVLDTNDIGPLQIAVYSIRNNTLTSELSSTIRVKDTARHLHIRVERLRDRIQAGSPQHWRFQLLDHRDRPVKGELMLSLYDASLDLIHALSWQTYIHRPEPRSVFSFEHFSPTHGLPELLNARAYGGAKSSARMNSASKMSAIAEDAVESEAIVSNATPKSSRSQLFELAFFHPQLRPDSAGFIDLRFTAPEGLTRWHLLGLSSALGRDFAYLDQNVSTFKNLMIFPNLPASIRQGDTLDLSVRISNALNTAAQGWCSLALLQDSLDMALICTSDRVAFSVDAQSSTHAQFRIVAKKTGRLHFEIKATTDLESDGERNAIEIIDHRSPIILSRSIALDSGQLSSVMTNDLFENNPQREQSRIQIDIAANPLWYVLEALAATENKEHRHSANQVLSDYLIYAMGKDFATHHPELGRLLESQMRSQTGLSQRSSVQNSLISLSPWDAQNELDRWDRIASFYKDGYAEAQCLSLSELLKTYQNTDGGFSWLPDYQSDLYTSVHIAQSLARMQQKGCDLPLDAMDIQRLTAYLDRWFEDQKSKTLSGAWDYSLLIDYAYARTFLDQGWSGDFWLSLLRDRLPKMSVEHQAHYASILIHKGQLGMADSVLSTVLASSVRPSANLLYWRKSHSTESKSSEIRRQVWIYEAFQKRDPQSDKLSPMLHWLLQQKRTSDWGSSEGTVYASQCLLYSKLYDIAQVADAKISLNDEVLPLTKVSPGFFSLTLNGDSLLQGRLEIQNSGMNPLWAGIFTMFTAPSALSRASGTELKVNKQVFRRESDGRTTKLVSDAQGRYAVNKGDLLTVQLIVDADRDYSYVVLSDDRASCLRPQERRSGPRYQGALSMYCAYERDKTYFYIPELRRGTHHINYPIVVTQSGFFSDGFAQIQCQYAPEFAGKSPGQSFQSTAK